MVRINPYFDDVILGDNADPAYAADALDFQAIQPVAPVNVNVNTPYRAGQTYQEIISRPEVQEQIKQGSETMSNIVKGVPNFIGDFLAQTLGRIAENMVNEESAQRGRELFQNQKEAAGMFGKLFSQLTPDQIQFYEQRTGKSTQRPSSLAEDFKDSFNFTLDTLLRDAIDGSKAIQGGARFTELPGNQQFGVFLLPLEFWLGGGGARRVVQETGESLVQKYKDMPLGELVVNPQAQQEIPEVIAQIQREYPVLQTSRPGRLETTEDFSLKPQSDMDLSLSQMEAADQRDKRFLTGKPRTGAITDARENKALPVIKALAEKNPDGLSKPQVITELKKTFPDLNDNQIESIFKGIRVVDGVKQSTFPFSQFMKEGAAAVGGETAKALSLKNLNEFDQYLTSNPPEKKLSQTAAVNLSRSITSSGQGVRGDKIKEFVEKNPNSAIAKFVAQPLKKGEDQLTSEVLQTLKTEYEVFDDFIPIATASRLTGIAENTLRNAVKKGTNGVDEFVQPQRAKGKKEAFIRSYIPAGGPDQDLTIQAKSLMTIDNFRGGLFGSTEKDFMKIMDEYGIIPKRIRQGDEFVENPNYLKNDAAFEKKMADNRERFYQDQIKYLDRGEDSLKDLEKMIEKRNAFGDYAKKQFKDLVRSNPLLKERFLEEYYRVLGGKFGGKKELLKDIKNYPEELFEKQLSDIARAFAGNAAHVTPISRVKGRTPKRGDQFKLSPKLRGKFSNPEFYRVNLSVDNIGRQPRFENIIVNNIKKINKIKSAPRGERFNILDKSINRIAEINQQMINNNMATLLEFSKKDLSPETMRKLIQEGTISRNAFEESEDKIILFLGKQEDMSLPELKQMFDDRLEKYRLAPELFKLSAQAPKGAKIDDEMFIRGSAPYIVKGFPLDFKDGGVVNMAIGGDPLTNLNQQQFAPDPAFEGQDFFKEAVDSGNLYAFNPLKLFKLFGKVDGVQTPKKITEPEVVDAPPGTTLPTTQVVQPQDFPFRSYTLEAIMDPNAPKAATPQAWADFLVKGKKSPISEIQDSGLEQYLRDFESYFPNQKITQKQLIDYYETSPIGNLSFKVKEDTPIRQNQDAAYSQYSGNQKHKEAGNQPLDELGTEYREIVVEAGPLPGETRPFVQSGHYSEPNVIGFTRVANYTGKDGRPIAVIQELQTDMLTTVRKEQERLQALLGRIKNYKASAEQKLQSASEYDVQTGQIMLQTLNQTYPPTVMKTLEENQNLIKPFPNEAGKELIPGFSADIQNLQKQIDAAVKADIAQTNPETGFLLTQINNQQMEVLNKLQDLNRSGEIDQILGGIKIPAASETEDLARIANDPNPSTLVDGFSYGQKDLTLFPPIPFNKQPDYVDLLVKATIKDAQSKGINKVAIYPADLVNRRWNKTPGSPEGKKFEDLYGKVAIQQMKNIAKKYGGTAQFEVIMDPTKASKGLRYYNRSLPNQSGTKFDFLKEEVPRADLSLEEVQPFFDEQIRRTIDGQGSDFRVAITREVAPGQTMDYFVLPADNDKGFLLQPFKAGDELEDAQIVIEEFNPQEIKMFTVTLDSPQAEQPMYLFKKKSGGSIDKDSLVSITDIYGEYGR